MKDNRSHYAGLRFVRKGNGIYAMNWTKKKVGKRWKIMYLSRSKII